MAQATTTKVNELFTTAETLDKKVVNLANGVKITAELKGMKGEAAEAEALIKTASRQPPRSTAVSTSGAISIRTKLRQWTSKQSLRNTRLRLRLSPAASNSH